MKSLHAFKKKTLASAPGIPLDFNAVAARIVPFIRRAIALKGNGGLPDKAQEADALDTGVTLLRDYLCELKIEQARARRQAEQLKSIVKNTDIGRDVRDELDAHENG